MIPGSFDYVAANNIPQAIALFEPYGNDAKILAGGQNLILLLRFRLAGACFICETRPSIFF